MEEQVVGSEITLKKIGNLCKYGWVRIVAYLLVAAVLCAAVLITVNSGTEQKEYVSDISFENDEMVNAKSPFGTAFDYAAIVKLPSVINGALSDCQYSESEINDMKEVIAKNINATATEGKDEKGNVIIGTKYYSVSLSKLSNIKLTDSAYNAIVDAIVKNSVEYIKNTYAYNVEFVKPAAFDKTTTNYIKEYALINSTIDNMDALINSLSAADSSFRSTETKQSFLDLNNRLSMVKTDMTSLVAYLTNNGVVNTANTRDTEIAYINQQVNIIDTEITAKTDTIAKKKAVLDSIKASYTTGDTVIQVGGLSTEDYYKLIVDYNKANEELASLNKQKVLWDNLSTAYGSSTEDANKQAVVNTLVENINNDINSLYDDLTKNVEEYNNRASLNDAVNVVSPAHKVKTSMISTKLTIIIELLVVVLAFILSLIVTNTKKNKNEIKVENN